MSYELSRTPYEYSPVDVDGSQFKGLLNTDYDQLRKDLQTPGDIAINKTYDNAGYQIRDVMGGGGMYGSSIHSDAISDNAYNRANALSSNASQAGAYVEQMRNADNQWLGNMALQESNMLNNWNLSQDQLNQGFLHDIGMADVNNDYALQQIDRQGDWNFRTQQMGYDAQEDASMMSGIGSIAGTLLGGPGIGTAIGGFLGGLFE